MSADTGVPGDPGSPGEEHSAPGGAPPRRLTRGRIAIGLVLLAAATLLVVHELRTSLVQSWVFTRLVDGASWEVVEGPSDRIRFPVEGPFDRRLGYTEIPRLIERAGNAGFRVVAQARVSPDFATLVDGGAFPIYEEKTQAGLALLGRGERDLFRAPHPARVYATFDSIPELVWRSLLFIESREFLDERFPRRNPAVEWDRLARGVGHLALSAIGSDRNVPGGSTLATQLEKFRHSKDGLTGSPAEKLRQMASASLRAYRDGPETLAQQRRIVRDYVNSVPLAAQEGLGEVVGFADGLWAWFGTDFDRANRLLRGTDLAPGEEPERARVYRQALSLLVAHRRPSYYLGTDEGRADLAELTDRHLRILATNGVIPADLARAALRARADVRPRAPELPPPSFIERKAANPLRAALATLLGANDLYELDRWDLTVATTLDVDWQETVARFLGSLADSAFVRERGFGAASLLTGVDSSADSSSVIYTFTLLERTPLGNVVRVQTDTHDGPLNLTDAGRLELGSTAKLRALVSYLEVMAELHGRLSILPPDSLRASTVAPQDRLTSWAVEFLGRRPDAGLREMLDAAMERTYSASPGERFATGGGVQTFANFDDEDDRRVMTVREAFRRSVNLPAIRMLRDVVHHHAHRDPEATARLFTDGDDPARREYLTRFADHEGSQLMRRFHAKYEALPPPAILDRMIEEGRPGPRQLARLFRAVAPEAHVHAMAEFLRARLPGARLTPQGVRELYESNDPDRYDLNDLGYLTGVHPLELWTARYLIEHPRAPLDRVLRASREARREAYGWLIENGGRAAQDQRIRTVLELEAFERIHASWRRLGYPFRSLVPSYGTAIGSSGDQPIALAELVGILVNGGVRYPTLRVEEMAFAEGTPFETRLRREPAAGERVLDPTVAAVARDALLDVVENGTGRRARGLIPGVAIGGKTGTGDNRHKVFAPGGGLVEDRVVNRTATLVFFVGDRHYGVVTAYAPGEIAARYEFTSALPAEIFRQVAPRLPGLGRAPGERLAAGERD